MRNSLIFIIIFLFNIRNLISWDLPTSTRAMGMGNAYIAIANDASGMSYNPAGILQNDSFIINFSSVNYYSIENLFLYSICVKWRNIGIKYQYLSTPVLIGKQNLEISYAYPIGNRLGIGINYKILKVSYDKDSYKYSDDLVLQSYNKYSLMAGLISSPVKNFSIGIVFFNEIKKFKEFNFKNLGLGFAYRFSSDFIAAMDIKFKQVLEDDYDIYTYIGLEKKITSNIIFRVGLYESNISFGIGLVYKYFVLNYAFLGNNNINNTQSVSMNIVF